jgi:hypothetical protein
MAYSIHMVARHHMRKAEEVHKTIRISAVVGEDRNPESPAWT